MDDDANTRHEPMDDGPGTAVPPQRRWRVLGLIGLAVVVSGIMACVPRWPQPPYFYDFADQREILGVPNFSDVMSNVPFAVVGALGMVFIARVAAAARRGRRTGLGRADRWAFGMFFTGVFLSALGSAYFHLDPCYQTLFWDRLPMAVAFMGLFSGVLTERVSRRAGAWLLGPLLLVGMASVCHWLWTETHGASDVRFYAVVQGLPLLAIPYLVWAFPAKYLPGRDLIIALGWYVVAKVLEILDTQVFALGGVVSGHTLKHITAAMGPYWLLRTLARRLLRAGHLPAEGT